MAHPAAPILARALESPDPAKVSTGSQSLDDALLGGFDYGRITCLSGSAGSGKTSLALHAITTQLITYPTAFAAYIDTTGSFNPFRLRDHVARRLRGRDGMTAASVLDRVQVMRVLDIYGVIEALDELRVAAEAIERDGNEHQDTAGGRSPELRGRRPAASDGDPDVELEIADSEASDDDDSLPFSAADSEPGNQLSGQVGVLVVDTLSNVVSTLMSRGHVHGT